MNLLNLSRDGFDSKLVRLKVFQNTKPSKPTKFRFQIGAIKSMDSEKIKLIDEFSFDSKLVRLKAQRLRIH